MSKNKRRADHLSEEDKKRLHELRLLRWQASISIVKLVIVVSGLLSSLYIVFALPVLYSAGKTTTINHVVSWMQSVNLPLWIAMVICTALGIGWERERSGRLKERKEAGGRIAELERQIDPARTSSGLLPDGRPSKESSE